MSFEIKNEPFDGNELVDEVKSDSYKLISVEKFDETYLKTLPIKMAIFINQSHYAKNEDSK